MGYVTKNINGWKWSSIEDFNTDNDALDLALGLPTDAKNVTTTAMEARENDNGVDPVFYYTATNDQFVGVLGAPIDFDIDVFVPDGD